MLAPFNMPRWPLAAPWLLHPSRVAFPGRHSKHWLSNLKCFTSQKLTNTRTHTHSHNYNMSRGGSILTGQPGEQLPMLHRRNSSVMSAFPFDTHLPSYPCPPSVPFVSPCDCHHTLLCFISVPFPLFLLKLSSNLHIQLSSRGDSTVSRRAVVSACCLPSCAWPVGAHSRAWATSTEAEGATSLPKPLLLFPGRSLLGLFSLFFLVLCSALLFFLLFEVFTTLPAHNGKQKA